MVIGIGGVSRAGKTTLAHAIAERFGHEAKILHQDDFIPPEEEIPQIQYQGVTKTDWECPASLDFAAFEQAILAAKAEHSVVLAEGLLVFWDPHIWRHFDYAIMLSVPKSVFWARKKLDMRWGEEPDWYIEHIWQSYLRYGQVPPHVHPLLRLSGRDPIDVNRVMDFLMEAPLSVGWR